MRSVPRAPLLLALALAPLLALAPAKAATPEENIAAAALPGGRNVSVSPELGAPANAPLTGETLERRTHEVAVLLRCPVCQGSSVGDSPSEMAQNMKREVRDLLALGYDQEQVLRHFELSYGEFIRLEPKVEGINLIVWLAPALLLLGGLLLVRRTLRQLRGTAGSASATQAAAPAAPAESEFESEFEDLDLPEEEPAAALAEQALAAKGAPTPAGASAPAAASPAWRTLAWVAASAAFIGLLIFFVQQSWTVAPPADSAMGAPPGSDEELAQLQAYADAHPDAYGQLELARVMFERGKYFEAFKYSSVALEREPNNPRALSYVALVRRAMGQLDVALELLGRAVENDPNFVEAWVYRGRMLGEAGRKEEAIAALQTARRLWPEGAAMIDADIEEVRNAAPPPPAAPTGAPAADPHAAIPTAGSRDVRLELSLDPSLQGRFVPGSAVFVMARPEGQQAGPPVAVKRIIAERFPIVVTLGSADAMSGGAFPERASIEVRLDADGNAMTREPTDPIARAEGVTPGASLRLVLQGPAAGASR